MISPLSLGVKEKFSNFFFLISKSIFVDGKNKPFLTEKCQYGCGYIFSLNVLRTIQPKM
jgi:hypothetical protein